MILMVEKIERMINGNDNGAWRFKTGRKWNILLTPSNTGRSYPVLLGEKHLNFLTDKKNHEANAKPKKRCNEDEDACRVMRVLYHMSHTQVYATQVRYSSYGYNNDHLPQTIDVSHFSHIIAAITLTALM